MKTSFLSLSLLAVLSSWLAPAVAAPLEDVAPVYVAVPIADLNVPAGTSQSIVNLKKTFGLTGVSGSVVRFSTTLGNVDVGLLSKEAPQTVSAFLTYANATADNTSGVPTYTNTVIQRAIDQFIVQGGGFYIDGNGKLAGIEGRSAIPSEAGVSNTRGTIAMALSNGPDSSVGDWFFNVADNTAGSPINNLDGPAGGGPFTVFGRVVGGLPVLDNIVSAALPANDHNFGGVLANCPTVDYTAGQTLTVSNLIYTKSITNLPLTPKGNGQPALLVLKVKGNTNPGLVTTSITSRKLALNYAPGATGSATITVLGKNTVTKTKASATFTVTVR